METQLPIAEPTADQAKGRAETADLAILDASKTAIQDSKELLADIAAEPGLPQPELP